MNANNNIVIENATIRFRNFSGNPGKFNPKGQRNFCVLFDDEMANRLADDGWNIKWLKPRNDEETPQAYLQVAVSFEPIVPKIILITGKGKTKLDEDSVNILDWAEIANVDLIVRPYNWSMNGKVGIKAYVKSMYVTLVEDEFEKKYYDVPDSAINSFSDEETPWENGK